MFVFSQHYLECHVLCLIQERNSIKFRSTRVLSMVMNDFNGDDMLLLDELDLYDIIMTFSTV